MTADDLESAAELVAKLAFLVPLAYVAARIWQDARHLRGSALASAMGRRVARGFVLGFALFGFIVAASSGYFLWIWPHLLAEHHPCFTDADVAPFHGDRDERLAVFRRFAGLSPASTRAEVASLFGPPEHERDPATHVYFHGGVEVRYAQDKVWAVRLDNGYALEAGGGISEGNARFLDAPVGRVVESFGTPEKARFGHYSYEFQAGNARGEVEFVCYEHDACRCSSIEVRWVPW